MMQVHRRRMRVLSWPKTVLWLEKQATASPCMRFQRVPRDSVWVSSAREAKPPGQGWHRPPTGTMTVPGSRTLPVFSGVMSEHFPRHLSGFPP